MLSKLLANFCGSIISLFTGCFFVKGTTDWDPPAYEVVKLNFDDKVHKQGKTGVGAVHDFKLRLRLCYN